MGQKNSSPDARLYFNAIYQALPKAGISRCARKADCVKAEANPEIASSSSGLNRNVPGIAIFFLFYSTLHLIQIIDEKNWIEGQNDQLGEAGGGSSSRFSYNTDWHDPTFSNERNEGIESRHNAKEKLIKCTTDSKKKGLHLMRLRRVNRRQQKKNWMGEGIETSERV